MSVNRALVEFYISYKLKQRNFPLDQLGLSEPAEDPSEPTGRGLDSEDLGGARTEPPGPGSDRTEPPGPGSDRTEPPGPGSDRTEAPGPGSDRTEPPGPGSDRTEAPGPGSDRTVGLDCVLGSSSSSSPPPSSAMLAPPDSAPSSPLPGLTNSAPPPAAPPPAAAVAPPTDLSLIKEALRDSALEFELRFSLAFSDLHRQLHLTPGSAYRSFESVMDEVFRDGVNWGRVVGLFAFGGALAVECVEKEMSPLVSKIIEWMTVYLDNHIQEWIDQQGGWSRFAVLYGDDAAAQARRSQESLRRWFWAGATLVTGVVVGSILATKRL